MSIANREKQDIALINKTIAFIEKEFADAEGGHDLSHTLRVRTNALLIAKEENCNLLIVELAALLHDIADSKFNDGDEHIGPRVASCFLDSIDCPSEVKSHVIAIIENISFKGGHNQRKFDSIELDIVQDADRLEAIGAVGIARAFNYGGYNNRALFDENIPPNFKMTKAEYKKGAAPTINHFYEKLFLLKDMMNTKKGKQMANERHQFLVVFLKQFFKECDFNAENTPFEFKFEHSSNQ